MKSIIITVVCCVSVVASNAQFILKGKIEYEKTVNQHKQMEWGDDGWAASFKKQIPEYKHSFFELFFADGKTLYKPGKEVNEKTLPWMGEGPASSNTVFSDINAQKIVAAKQVFDESFLIQDSLAKFRWRLTGETRNIAGFECKRATTVIMDSVFVVAFYTDEIITPGGPESFNGLPGMILGVVIPRMFTNWYATKLELEQVTEAKLAAPKKGKPVNYKSVEKTIEKSLKQWGAWSNKFIWQIMI